MSTPLSDAQLAAITAQPLDRFTVQQCPAGVHADWAADTENAHACPWCEVERLRAELTQARAARLEWSRTADHAELVRWAEALVDADLTPHPAFAFRSTTAGYEVAVQVATTDALRDNARAELLAELRKAFDATICQVLGYRPTVARQAADTTSKEA